jgi:hypothetical protein
MISAAVLLQQAAAALAAEVVDGMAWCLLTQLVC